MSGVAVLQRLEARWARSGFPPYPWWVTVSMEVSALVAVAVAAGQRTGLHPPLPVLALALLAAAPWLLCFAGWGMPWPAFTAAVVTPMSALIALYPVTYDFAALVLVMLVGHVGAIKPVRSSVTALGITALALVLLWRTGQFDGTSFALAGLLVGWDVGFLMQYQQRRLEDQQRDQQAGEERAALEERQRIAREVHDVIAHSLSVTLMHLTAARRGLEEDLGDGRQGPVDAEDVADAVEGLRDAERLGRQAMADIRRTVGLLGSGRASSTAPAAGLDDLPALVAELARAGLDVRYDVRGEATGVAPTTALGVYRVAQESLSNVAKHQPQARVEVCLELDREPARLTVRSTLTDPPVGDGVYQDRGSGLRGMAERAELMGGTLRAGPLDGEWLVELAFPHSDHAAEAVRASAEPGAGRLDEDSGTCSVGSWRPGLAPSRTTT